MKIQYLTPYAVDLNIGKAYNDAIADTSAEWICLRDGDTMFLTPDWGRVIDEVISNAEYDLYGCVTNRLGDTTQTVPGMFNEMDITKHYEKAKEVESKYSVTPHSGAVAGCFMLFKRSLWEQIKFAENTPCFDFIFTRDAERLGYKIGLIRHLYIFHGYRIWQKDRTAAWHDSAHLFI